MIATVQALLAAAAVYLLIGLAFGIWFVAGGYRRIDPNGISTGARLLILPGSAALWPLLAARVLRRGAGRDEGQLP